MSAEEIKAYLAKIGSKGGKKSKRTLTTEQAKAMVKAREKKRKAKGKTKLSKGRKTSRLKP